MRRLRLIPPLVAVVLCGGILAAPARALELARNGEALVPIRIGAEASEPERTAARDLSAYLEKITGAEFSIETGPGSGPSIEVGWRPAIRTVRPSSANVGWSVRVSRWRQWRGLTS